MLLTIDSITLATLYGMYHKGGRFSGYFIIQTITILLVNFFHFMTSCVNQALQPSRSIQRQINTVGNASSSRSKDNSTATAAESA